MINSLILFVFSTVIFFLSTFSTPLQISKPPDFSSSLDSADTYYKDGEYREALRIYRNLGEKNSSLSGDPGFRMKMGIASYYSGAYNDALTLLDDTILNDPDLHDYCLYYRSYALERLNQDTLALNTLQRFYTKDFSTQIVRDAALLKVHIFRSLKQYQQANTVLNQLINVCKDTDQKANLYFIYAKNCFALSMPGMGYTTVKNVINNYSNTTSAIDAVELYLEEKRSRKESLTFEEIDWVLDFLLSIREGKKAVEVIQEYKVIESQFGKTDQMRYHSARAFYYTGSFKKAEVLFQEVYKTSGIESLKSQSVLFLARCNIQQGKEQKAIQYYREHIIKFPRSSMTGEILWKLGWLAETQKEYQTALKYYLRLERGRSEYRERGMMRAGCCYYQMKQFRQALRIFDRLAKNGTEESMRQGGYYWQAKTLYKTVDSTSSKNVLTVLFSKYPLHYYSFRAQEWARNSNSINTGNSLNIDSLFALPKDLPDDPKIRKAVRIGEIIGKRYGEAELASLQNDSPKRYSDINDLWVAYHRIGAFKQSLRIAIREMKSEEEQGKTIPAVPLLRKAFPPYYWSWILKNAQEVNVSPALVFALIRRESSFDEDIRSSAGALGLMQIMLKTGKSLGKEKGLTDITYAHLIQPQWNIVLGVQYLRKQIDDFQGNLPAAIAAYNAGPEVVKRWLSYFSGEDSDYFIEAIEYTETRNYVKRVLGDYWMYKQLYCL